jgi:hypothetical protein
MAIGFHRYGGGGMTEERGTTTEEATEREAERDWAEKS